MISFFNYDFFCHGFQRGVPRYNNKSNLELVSISPGIPFFPPNFLGHDLDYPRRDTNGSGRLMRVSCFNVSYLKTCNTCFRVAPVLVETS